MSARSYHRLEVVHRLALRAMQAGCRRLSVATFEWDVSGNCQSPVNREMIGRVDRDHVLTFRGGVPHVTRGVPRRRQIRSMTVIMICKCRKCENCLRKRSAHWAMRAESEIRQAARTWMATFTWSPQAQYLLALRARKRATAKGLAYQFATDGLSPEEFRMVAEEAGADITLFIKRLRKGAKARLRYLLVCEAHESGLPHFHALIHETAMSAVTHKLLTEQWPHGFSKFKLVENVSAARYVAKYCSKSAQARVRASSGYGKLRTDCIGLFGTLGKRPCEGSLPELQHSEGL